MSDNIQATIIGQILPFNANSNQSVEDKLKRVILHDLEYGNQGRIGKFDEK